MLLRKRCGVLAACVASLLLAACETPKPVAGGPTKATLTPLGKVIESAHAPIHVIYVHGIRADGPGASKPFREAICKRVADTCPNGMVKALPSIPLDIGPPPKGADPVEWAAARPFLDRYVFERPDKPAVVVDEVNWWPLLFPFKCRSLLAAEAANLAGVDEAHLNLCARTNPPYHPWLSQGAVDALIAGKPVSGGGAKVNVDLKLQIMDWGFADAVVALGPMKAQIRTAMNDAFGQAAAFEKRGVEGQQFVIISESLGSFVVMDAYSEGARSAGMGAAAPESASTLAVVGASSDLYFFANQFALLELGRAETLPPAPATSDGAASGVAGAATGHDGGLVASALRDWARSSAVQRRQIVSFSDPSDLLTWYVPSLSDAGGREVPVMNVYVRNVRPVFGLADPAKAHTGHSGNSVVIDWVFDGPPP